MARGRGYCSYCKQRSSLSNPLPRIVLSSYLCSSHPYHRTPICFLRRIPYPLHSNGRTIVICLTSFSIPESLLVLNYRITGHGISLTNSFSNSSRSAIIANEQQNDKMMMPIFSGRLQPFGVVTLCLMCFTV
jgi:hypothetical protein